MINDYLEAPRALFVRGSTADSYVNNGRLQDVLPSVMVTDVASLAEAIAALKHESVDGLCGCSKFDAVVLDVYLPNGEGVACVKALRDACSKISIVVLTDLEEAEIDAYFDAGADDFLEKGVSYRQMGATILRACRATHRQRRFSKKWETIGTQMLVLEKLTSGLLADTPAEGDTSNA